MTKKYILVGAAPSKEAPPNPGGQLTASLGLISYVHSMGNEIEVLDTTQSSFPVPPLFERLNKGKHRVLSLIRIIKHDRISGVILFSSSGMSFYERIVMSAICNLYKVPNVLMIRSGHFMSMIKKSFINRLLAKLLLKIPGSIGSQGNDWLDFYHELGVKHNKLFLVRNWLGDDFKTAKVAKKYRGRTIKFVFVGWMVKEKGVERLLEATLALVKGGYNFSLEFIGGGTLEEYARSYVRKNALNDSVLVYGWKDKAFISQLFESVDVFVLPSESEGFPNALLEAMASGLPAICTRVGGVSDSLKSGINGFLLENNDCDTIVQAMKSYLDKPDLIQKHSKATLEIFDKNHNKESNCRALFNQL